MRRWACLGLRALPSWLQVRPSMDIFPRGWEVPRGESARGSRKRRPSMKRWRWRTTIWAQPSRCRHWPLSAEFLRHRSFWDIQPVLCRDACRFHMSVCPSDGSCTDIGRMSLLRWPWQKVSPWRLRLFRCLCSGYALPWAHSSWTSNTGRRSMRCVRSGHTFLSRIRWSLHGNGGNSMRRRCRPKGCVRVLVLRWRYLWCAERYRHIRRAVPLSHILRGRWWSCVRRFCRSRRPWVRRCRSGAMLPCRMNSWVRVRSSSCRRAGTGCSRS